MARARMYTDEEKAAVFLALTTHEGNVERSSRDTGVPASTVRGWKKEWAEQGASQEIVAAAAVEADKFITDATRVRDAALAQIEEKLPTAKVSELNAVVGTLDDKIVRARAITRGQGDDKPQQIDAAAVGELLAGFVGEALKQSREREAAISNATGEQAVGALPRQT